jgi:hypothetical protein
MLGCLLHAPGGPFYIPKAARSRWRQSWKANLAFCRVAHRTPDTHYRRSGVDLFPFLTQMTVAAPWQLAHRTLSGAHRTVRCLLPTVGAGHASPADCAADRCPVDRWLTGQSGEFYPYAADPFPESDNFTADDSPDSPVHHQIVQ